jgi:SPP1 family predicted phage head-tail adaptor
MQAGTLDHRLRIERKVVTQDVSFGTEVITWATLATVWAEVQEVLPSKGEDQASGIRIAERPARIRMRYRSDVTSDMRLVHISRGNRLMKIIAPPVEMGRRQGLEIMAADYSTEGQGA